METEHSDYEGQWDFSSWWYKAMRDWKWKSALRTRAKHMYSVLGGFSVKVSLQPQNVISKGKNTYNFKHPQGEMLTHCCKWAKAAITHINHYLRHHFPVGASSYIPLCTFGWHGKQRTKLCWIGSLTTRLTVQDCILADQFHNHMPPRSHILIPQPCPQHDWWAGPAFGPHHEWGPAVQLTCLTDY